MYLQFFVTEEVLPNFEENFDLENVVSQINSELFIEKLKQSCHDLDEIAFFRARLYRRF